MKRNLLISVGMAVVLFVYGFLLSNANHNHKEHVSEEVEHANEHSH